MSTVIQKVMGGKTASKLEARKEKLISQGQIGNSVNAGIQNLAVFDESGNKLAPGSYYTFGDQTVLTTNGQYRFIDGGMMAEDVNKTKAQDKMVMDLVDLFVSTGDNRIAKKYLGGYAELLKAGGNAEQFLPLLGYEGADGDMTNDKGDAVKMNAVNAQPSHLRFLNKTSANFANGVNKMRVIIQASGIVVSGKKMDRRPEGVDKVQEAKINSGDTAFNPDQLFKDPTPPAPPAGSGTLGKIE
jgi:hypothetical protein